MGEYSPAKTGEYPRIFPNFQNRARCVKDLKDNKDNSLHLGRKYARIFVLGHYLFLVAHSFPRATLSENCSLLGTDNVRGQISEHIFAPNGGYCLYIFAPSGGYCLLFIYIYISLTAPRSQPLRQLPVVCSERYIQMREGVVLVAGYEVSIHIYYMEESILLGTNPLVDSIRHFIRDPSGVLSVCHLCECRIVQ